MSDNQGFYRGKLHTQARILAGPEYDGQLIDRLADIVEQRITTASTEETPACSRYEADNCTHCHASYGHKGYCPLLNRETAEAISALNNPTEQERIRARGLGVIL